MARAVAAWRNPSFDHLRVVYPGQHRFPLGDQITAWPVDEIPDRPDAIERTAGTGLHGPRRSPRTIQLIPRAPATSTI